MNAHWIPASFLLLGIAGVADAQSVSAPMSRERRAELVLRLLPAEARPLATVVLRDGSREERYRDGSGRFLCVSDASSTERLSMVCHHHVLEERLRLERELSRETGLQGAAFRERLCREVTERGWTVPDGAMEITASLPRTADGSYAREMTVYHLLWLPHQTMESTGIVEKDPGDGLPFLHQGATCGAHVMWSEVVAADGTCPAAGAAP